MNGQSRLILYPVDPLLELALQPLLKLLQQQSIIAQPLPADLEREGYQVGEGFFDAFLFLGCSPSVELTPSIHHPEQPFCYLQLESTPYCELITGSNLKAACPSCKKRLEVPPVVKQDKRKELLIYCGHCGCDSKDLSVAWRKTAALSSTRISLWNIFEGEAIPSDRLLDQLQQQSGLLWRYSYIVEG